MRGWPSVFQGFIVVTLASLFVGCNEREANADAPSKSVASITAANNEFAWNLYKEVRRTNENLICSPYSISYPMGLIYSGARSNTAIEIAQAMRYPSNAVDQSMHDLADCLRRANSRDVELNLANAMWASPDVRFLPTFIKAAKQQYRCEVRNADFRSNPDAVVTQLNSWVTDHMNGKLQGGLLPGSFDENTRLVLVNTIYFHGLWKSKFDKNETSNSAFYVSDKQTIDVPMMKQTGKFRYRESENFQVLELPYKSGAVSMYFVLPVDPDGLAQVESSLQASELSKLFNSLKMIEDTDVTIPQFSLKSDHSLNDSLRQLGIHEAFTDRADFSSMDGSKHAYLSSIRQQAFVEVDEDGTKAGARTVIISQSLGVHQTPHFTADHPFLFFITENSTGAILFCGRVVDPSKS